MKTCLCCGEKLLHHICKNRCYWFCPDCRQAMPATDEVALSTYNRCLSDACLSDTVKS
ncbi:MAG: hypothetical protein WBA77_13565 [Microcoleaceae cyanobacterium]